MWKTCKFRATLSRLTKCTNTNNKLLEWVNTAIYILTENNPSLYNWSIIITIQWNSNYINPSEKYDETVVQIQSITWHSRGHYSPFLFCHWFFRNSLTLFFLLFILSLTVKAPYSLPHPPQYLWSCPWVIATCVFPFVAICYPQFPAL